MVSSISASAPNYYNHYKTGTKNKTAQAQEDFALPVDTAQAANKQTQTKAAEQAQVGDNTNKAPFDENGKVQERFPWEIAEMELSVSLLFTASCATSKMTKLHTPGEIVRMTDPSSTFEGVTEGEVLEYMKQYSELLRQAHDEITSETGFYSLDQSQVDPEQRKKVLEDIVQRFKEYPEAKELTDKLGMTAETSYGLPYNPDYPVEEKVSIVSGADMLAQKDVKIYTKEEFAAMYEARKSESASEEPEDSTENSQPARQLYINGQLYTGGSETAAQNTSAADEDKKSEPGTQAAKSHAAATNFSYQVNNNLRGKMGVNRFDHMRAGTNADAIRKSFSLFKRRPD